MTKFVTFLILVNAFTALVILGAAFGLPMLNASTPFTSIMVFVETVLQAIHG